MSRLSGISDEARTVALDDLYSGYQSELEGFKTGPTYTQLSENFAAQGDAAKGSMESFYGGQFGEYQPRGTQSTEPGQRFKSGPPVRPGGSGSEAAVAGLGETRRPWWSAA